MVVQIRNDLPVQIICEGINFKETQRLSFKDLSLFIERDLFTLSKSIAGSELNVTHISRNGSSQFIVSGKLRQENQIESTSKRIEKILWSYNRQQLIARKGGLYPQASRFTFKIDLSAYLDEIVEVPHA